MNKYGAIGKTGYLLFTNIYAGIRWYFLACKDERCGDLMNLGPGCVLPHPAGHWTTLPDVFAAQLLPPEPKVLAGCENNLRLRQKDSAKYR
jgi:hypothetical protein